MKRSLGFYILLVLGVFITGCSEAPHSTKQSVVANPPDIPAPPPEQTENLPTASEQETPELSETTGVESQSPSQAEASGEADDEESEPSQSEDSPEAEH